MTGFCGDCTIARVASVGGSLETGARAALYVSAVTSSWVMGTTRSHDGWTKESGGERRGGSGTMHYGSQKIRDPDMRARHVPRHAGLTRVRLLVSSSSLPLHERNLLWKCRYVDEGESATIASSLSSRLPFVTRRVNIRLVDAHLDCVYYKSLSETSLLRKFLSVWK